MARVTVEDCVVKVPNRFDLVMRAAQRARAVSAGAPLTVERDNDKNPVVALREIAEETIDIEELGNALIKDQQKHVEMDEPEEDDMAALMAGKEWSEPVATEIEEADGMEVFATPGEEPGIKVGEDVPVEKAPAETDEE